MANPQLLEPHTSVPFPAQFPARFGPVALLALGTAALAITLAPAAPAQASPIVCTTTLEAPLTGGGGLDGRPPAPVEVTRCEAVQTVPSLVERRYYSYTAPYARGVSITNQITDLLGIAMGGGDGTRMMGFGFPDQAIIWDGSAIQNTYQVLNENQSDPMPWRTADVSNGFSGNLGNEQPAQTPWQDTGSTWSPPVRGLW
ncbi:MULTISPECIES: hypothetical protein [Aphanothece]|uniref:hypothetical protein n=1 Tax=Aphanothece TaxID=1121 RepID=UPI0039848B8D